MEFTIKYWRKALGRRLKKYECEIINEVRCENNMNESILQIAENVKEYGLYIPELSPNDGNCLFHSLCYHKLADNVDMFKKSLVNIMFFFKNMKNFIPNQELTLEELFGMYNDIEYVYCNNKNKLYKYNYDIMCMDLLTNRSWKRINTELILTIISVALNIKIIIYHDNGHKTQICPQENDKTKNIYLAHIGECHYIPLDVITENTEINILQYYEDKEKYDFWKKNVECENDDEEYNVLSEDEFEELYSKF